MTKLKSFFVALSICCFALTSFAAPFFTINPASPNETKALSEEVSAYIKNIDIAALNLGEDKFHINFIVNNENEIVVMSTSNEDFDRIFKSALNYKSVKADGIERFKVFTLPVTLKKN